MKLDNDSKYKGISRKAFLGGCAAVAAGMSTLTLQGCKRTDGESTKTISYYIGNPVSIDPYNAQENNGNEVCRQLFDPLFEMDFNTNELKGVAAETEYSVNEEGTVFTFKIKQGNTFHNGEPVDAYSFVRGWNRLVNPRTGNSPSVVSYYLETVKGYEDVQNGMTDQLIGLSCPDDYTLRVELSVPFMDFPMITTIMCTSPIPQVALEDFEKFFQAPIGNGPYRMDGKWQDGQRIYVTEYENYVNGPHPHIKNVHFMIQKDLETGFREFEAANIDIVDIPTNQVKEMVSRYGTADDGYTISPGHQVLLGDLPSIYYLTVNLKDFVMQDVNLRRAISLAINRENIVNTIMEGTRLAADNFIPPHVSGYVEGQWSYSRYDKQAALAILNKYYPEQSPGDRGLSIKLTYNVDGSHKAIMEAVAADLAEVGIQTEQVTKEWAAVLADYQGKDYQLGRGGWLAEYPSIDDFLYPLMYTGTGDNTSGFTNSTFDKLLLQARSTKDEAKRLAIYHEANKLAADFVPYIPLMFYRASKVGSSRIKQAYISPTLICSAANWELES